MSVCSLMVSAYVSKAVEGVTAADVKTTIGATRILAAYVSITQCVMYFTSDDSSLCAMSFMCF